MRAMLLSDRHEIRGVFACFSPKTRVLTGLTRDRNDRKVLIYPAVYGSIFCKSSYRSRGARLAGGSWIFIAQYPWLQTSLDTYNFLAGNHQSFRVASDVFGYVCMNRYKKDGQIDD